MPGKLMKEKNAEENHEVIDETLLPVSVQEEVELEEEGITTEEERMLTQIKENWSIQKD